MSFFFCGDKIRSIRVGKKLFYGGQDVYKTKAGLGSAVRRTIIQIFFGRGRFWLKGSSKK